MVHTATSFTGFPSTEVSGNDLGCALGHLCWVQGLPGLGLRLLPGATGPLGGHLWGWCSGPPGLGLCPNRGRGRWWLAQ